MIKKITIFIFQEKAAISTENVMAKKNYFQSNYVNTPPPPDLRKQFLQLKFRLSLNTFP